MEPIDILEIAARRLHDAQAAVSGTMMLQSSAGAQVAAQLAVALFNQARADMDAVQDVALAIADHENRLCQLRARWSRCTTDNGWMAR